MLCQREKRIKRLCPFSFQSRAETLGLFIFIATYLLHGVLFKACNFLLTCCYIMDLFGVQFPLTGR